MWYLLEAILGTGNPEKIDERPDPSVEGYRKQGKSSAHKPRSLG